MSTMSWVQTAFGGRRDDALRAVTPRIFSAEEAARIDLDAEVAETRQEILDLRDEQGYLRKLVERCDDRIAQLQARLSGPVDRSPWVTLVAWLAVVSFLAMIVLDITMIQALGTPWPMAVLLGLLLSSAFTGGSLLAHRWWDESDGSDRSRALALFAALLVAAAIVAPVLAGARADEQYSSGITSAITTVNTATSYVGGDDSANATLQLEQAKADLADLRDKRELTKWVFATIMGAAILVEICFSSHMTDLPTHWRISRATRRRRKAADDAEGVDTDLNQAIVSLQTETNNTATRYGLDLDTVGQMVEERIVALRELAGRLADLAATVTLAPAPPVAPPTRVPSAPAPTLAPAPAPAPVPGPETWVQAATDWDGRWA